MMWIRLYSCTIQKNGELFYILRQTFRLHKKRVISRRVYQLYAGQGGLCSWFRLV